VLSYARARLRPRKDPKSFEDWVSNQFGERLFRIFFKTYTEKVWGMSCREISADWAAQRIKGLSLFEAIKSAFAPRSPGRRKNKDQVIKTLIDSFRYPRKGPGMMWEACAGKIEAMGGTILMGHKAVGLAWDEANGHWVVEAQSVQAPGTSRRITADHVISSAPMRELVQAIRPEPSARAVTAARALGYRDFLTVTLVLKGEELFDDNWIYIHDPGVKVGRIQNFKSWSPEMVPHPDYHCYGLEYFCFEGDGLWSMPDEELIALAQSELGKVGLGGRNEFVRGYVVRQPKAYPVYDEHYQQNVDTIRAELEKRFPTLHLVGRNGMHKYNNQDHAIMTAMLTAQNILAGRRLYDVWQVNQDAEYHESGSRPATDGASGVRAVPSRIQPDRAA
jgi:protoporphyrinogen oxidase